MKLMTLEEMSETKGGEAITISSILAIMSIAVMAVVTYRLFKSGTNRAGKVSLPGGFTFSW